MKARPFYVNLPLRSIAADDTFLTYFLEHGLNPEIGIDAFAVERLSPRWHNRLARRLDEAGLTASVHLPFQDLHPGGTDTLIRQASRERLHQSLDIANRYNPRHLIGHALYADPLYFTRYGEWLDNSTETWTNLLAAWPDGPPLYLENVYETRPDSFADLLSRLPDDRTGFCLDVGHWHCFGGGHHSQDLDHWLTTLAPNLKHLHLHDNDGTADQHLGLGQGDVPLTQLFKTLHTLHLTPTATLEPHTEDALLATLHTLSQHPTWLGQV